MIANETKPAIVTETVTTEEQTKVLYDCSALTWVGLDTQSLPDVIEWMKKYGVNTDKAVFHITTGKTMNAIYGLRGNTAYPADLTIVSVTGIDQRKLVLPRFEVDGKWFDDVVDNNRHNNGDDDEYDED